MQLCVALRVMKEPVSPSCCHEFYIFTLSFTLLMFSFALLRHTGVFFVGFRPLIQNRKVQSTGPKFTFRFECSKTQTFIDTHTLHSEQSTANGETANGEREREREREREKRDCACCMFLFCVFTTQTQHKEHTVKRNDPRSTPLIADPVNFNA